MVEGPQGTHLQGPQNRAPNKYASTAPKKRQVTECSQKDRTNKGGGRKGGSRDFSVLMVLFEALPKASESLSNKTLLNWITGSRSLDADGHTLT